MTLTQEHIQAATRLRELLPDWRRADAALTQLGEKFPGYSEVECLLKTVAVNAKRVNAELRELFEHPSAEQATELHALLPANIERAFIIGQCG